MRCGMEERGTKVDCKDCGLLLLRNMHYIYASLASRSADPRHRDRLRVPFDPEQLARLQGVSDAPQLDIVV